MFPTLEGFKMVAVTNTKTARAENSKVYWCHAFGGPQEALEVARVDSPRRKSFYALMRNEVSGQDIAKEFRVD